MTRPSDELGDPVIIGGHYWSSKRVRCIYLTQVWRLNQGNIQPVESGVGAGWLAGNLCAFC